MTMKPLMSATLFAVAVMAPAAEPAPPVSATSGAVSAEVQKLLDSANALNGGAEAYASYHYEQGKKEQAANRLAEALDHFKSAVRLAPNNKTYKDALSNAEAMGGNSRQTLGTGVSDYARMNDVAVQELQQQIAKFLADGERQMLDKKYIEADRSLNMALTRINSLPVWIDGKPEQIRSVERLIAENSSRRQAAELELQSARAESARTKSEDLRREALRIERDRIEAMLSRATRARERREYDEAILLCEQVLKINRAEPRADAMLPVLRRERHVWLRQVLSDQWEESHRRLSEQIRKDLLPQHELIRYSTEWPEIDARRHAPSYDLNDKSEAWRAVIDNQLEQDIALDFPETDFNDVIGYIRKISGVNIIVDASLAAKPAPVQIRVDKMRLRSVLEHLMKLTGYKYVVRNEAIYIGTDAQVAGDAVLKFYDIRDLTHPLKSFPGPTLELPDSNTAAGVTLLPPIESVQPQNASNFIDLLKKVVAPQSWTGVNTIEDVQGQMMVNQSPAVHKQIESLLKQLRNHTGTQIHVKVRFLEVENSLIEEIGVNWQNFNPLVGNGLGGLTPPPGVPNPLPGTNPIGNSTARPPVIGPTGTPGALYRPTGNDTIAGSLISSSLLPYTDSSGLARPNSNVGLSLSTQYWKLADSVFARAIIHAVEQERRGNVLYAPEITLFSGQQSHLVQLNQQAYIADYNATGDAYEPVVRTVVYGSVIDVHAVASADRRYITMTLRPTNAQIAAWRSFGGAPVNAAGASLGTSNGPGVSENLAIGVSYPLQIPTLDLQRVQTTVVLPDGGSLVLSSRTNSSTARASSGVPFLSHIPFLGRLFSTNGRSETELKTLIVVTANLIIFPEIEAGL